MLWSINRRRRLKTKVLLKESRRELRENSKHLNEMSISSLSEILKTTVYIVYIQKGEEA